MERLDTVTLRRLAVRYQVDPRTITKEFRAPGSVVGMAGDRARSALASIGFEFLRSDARRIAS